MIRFIRSLVQKYKARREAKREARRQRVRDALARPLSEREIYEINTSIIANSAGWMGGKMTERQIKWEILAAQSRLFSAVEFDELAQRYCV